jgi:hypothetical protein
MLCWLFGHKNVTSNKYFPSIDAIIVKRWSQTNKCVRCGSEKEFTYFFDEE